MNEYTFTDCFDHDNTCAGDVNEWYSRSGITKSVRCDKHYAEKEAKLDEIARRYPDSPVAPSWFDASYAGERWDSDY